MHYHYSEKCIIEILRRAVLVNSFIIKSMKIAINDETYELLHETHRKICNPVIEVSIVAKTLAS